MGCFGAWRFVSAETIAACIGDADYSAPCAVMTAMGRAESAWRAALSRTDAGRRPSGNRRARTRSG